ncbi:MAG: ABC transporter ATP-binding protein [Bacteroidetes bacterium]|nr:ABC transporter ATP-binding protein [Bacteroidota bacterium]
MHPLLSIKNLSLDFITESVTTHALKNISLIVNKNEVVALVGESGSGKSVTSLSVLRLLPSPPAKFTSGSILFSENGETAIDILAKQKKEMQEIRGNKIAMIFQEPMTSLNPVFTCGHQVMEAILKHKAISKEEAKKQTLDWFHKVKLPNPETVFKRYPHQLSGGQKQRVMIAMAMSCNPSLLICDEPTTALDVTVQKTILELIKELQQQTGMGVLFITHDLSLVAEIADRSIVMYKGEIVEQNNVQNIFNAPNHPYTRALLACRPANHQRGQRLPIVADFLNPSQSKANDSKEVVLNTENKKNHQQEALISVSNLSVWFPDKKTFLGKPLSFTKAVDEVSFEVFKGETLGLVGESGCGKTTLGRTLLRLTEPTAGKIIYSGIELTAKKRSELASMRKDIQIIFQDPYSSLNPRITIGVAISEPLKVHKLFPTEKGRKEKVIELLEKVDLKAEHFNRYPHEFSGGQRQRIVIARALSLNPSFIVCDESVSALDVSVQAQVLNLLNDLKKEMGFTAIFISHDLSVVRYISDRIMVMNKGKIEETGLADDVYFNPQSPYTKNLIASIPKSLPKHKIN